MLLFEICYATEQMYILRYANQITLPEAYVVATASIADRGRWTWDLLSVTMRAVNNMAVVDIIDEEQTNAEGDLKAIIYKISEPLLPEQFARLSANLQSVCQPGAQVRLLRGVIVLDQVILSKEVMTEYFRREFAVDCREVKHTDSCVKLTHLPTGYVARSTTHRKRALNFDEALFYLASLLGEQNHEV